jgi:hypothetical protein
MSMPRLPSPTRYLRVFLFSLTLVFLCLAGFLFGVRMEAVVTAPGTLKAKGQHEVRALVAGLVELGWHEGTVAGPSGPPLHARLDPQGNGRTDPSAGKALAVQAYGLADGSGRRIGPTRFHRLEAGDILWPEQILGRVRADELRLELSRVQQRLEEVQGQGQSDHALQAQRDLLRERLAQSLVYAPQGEGAWLVLKVRVEPLAAVQPGDALALIAPCDARTGQPRDVIAELDVPESHYDGLAPGQEVRLYSATHNHRLHGHAEGRLERLGPLAEAAGGGRSFRAVAAVTESPFPLLSGSSIKAEIVTGRKPVYRIILEH